MTIYYLISEALSNAVKYAGATRVRVAVAQGPDRIVTEVDDDGHGGADPASGTGLAGLASRIEALGGTLDVASHEGGAPGSPRGSRSRRGATRASRSSSSATTTTAAPAPS